MGIGGGGGVRGSDVQGQLDGVVRNKFIYQWIAGTTSIVRGSNVS